MNMLFICDLVAESDTEWIHWWSISSEQGYTQQTARLDKLYRDWSPQVWEILH